MNWLKRFLHNQSSIWSIIPRYVFSQLGGIHFLLMCNYSVSKLPIKLSNYHQQMLTAWRLIYKHNSSPHNLFFIWNNCNILHKRKSLFLENWFNTGVMLVNQLFISDGNLCTYSDFVSRYHIPVSCKEFNMVFKAISLEISMLFRNPNSATVTSVCPPKPESTVAGSICFSVQKSNYKIRSLFLDLVTSIPSSISYWNNLFDDIKWSY